MLHIDNLTKIYRRGPRANDGITLDLAAGQVLGLLGHNGAGKTTLLGQIVGLVRPTSGHIALLGRDPVAEPAWARTVCSFQPQSQAPLTGVTARQAINIISRIRGAGRRAAQQRTLDLLRALDIEEWADQPGEQLSGGVRRLTAFCMAIAHPGSLVMLDEPTNDVDPMRRRLLWQQVRALADDGHAVVLVTHNIAEAERVIDRVAVLDHGRITATGSPAELVADTRMRLELTPTGDPTIPAWSLHTARHGDRFTVTLAAEHAPLAVAWAQTVASRYALHSVSLEDAYLTLSDNPEGDPDAALVP